VHELLSWPLLFLFHGPLHPSVPPTELPGHLVSFSVSFQTASLESNSLSWLSALLHWPPRLSASRFCLCNNPSNIHLLSVPPILSNCFLEPRHGARQECCKREVRGRRLQKLKGHLGTGVFSHHEQPEARTDIQGAGACPPKHTIHSVCIVLRCHAQGMWLSLASGRVVTGAHG
jgi:hypothetical protein